MRDLTCVPRRASSKKIHEEFWSEWCLCRRWWGTLFMSILLSFLLTKTILAGVWLMPTAFAEPNR
jgi:hypothetical protein